MAHFDKGLLGLVIIVMTILFCTLAITTGNNANTWIEAFTREGFLIIGIGVAVFAHKIGTNP